MTTALDIITKAMQKAGILTKSEAPSSDEASDGLDALNDMLSSWSNESMLIHARSTENFSITSGTAAYTIGPSATFDTTRPVFIADAFVRDSSGTDTYVQIITQETYDTISDKDTQGTPNRLVYNNGFPQGTITVYPVPSTTYTLFILSEKQLVEFTLNEVVSLPPGWKRALIYNLCEELRPEYGQQADPMVAKIARDSKSAIKTAIMRNRTMDTPYMMYLGNIYNGWQQ